MLEVVKTEEEKFCQLFNDIGLSVDWSLKYQTISPLSCKISQMSFLDLVNKKQVYRSNQPVLWDYIDQTALSQADIEDKDRVASMYYIFFTTVESKLKLQIATTRPELLPACCAVFFNPNDQRYQHLHNQFATTPLFESIVPILAEETVDINKGSGLVMCCTFGDVKDVAWWRKHNLPTRIMIDYYGKIKPLDFTVISQNQAKFVQCYQQITDMKISQARNKIVELLQQNQLIIKQEQVSQTVKQAERSGAVLEIVMAPQWFIKVVEHKNALLQKAQELEWYPKSMKIKLDNWINSLSWDWCISRQRYFGVPFPVWYSKRLGEEGKIIFADISQLPVDPLYELPAGYSKNEVIPDLDVMDTWATSSLSPQLSSYGISQNLTVDSTRHKQLFPADLRPQAHEIIRTWTFYTMVKSYLHQNSLPWSKIMISGWCLADDRNKMSKSKGNVIMPTELIQLYGADAVRYWASTSALGHDCVVSEQVISIGKKLVNKLFNATKFILQHITNKLLAEHIISIKYCVEHKIIACTTDLWMLSKLQNIVNSASQLLENYEYAAARLQIEEFFLKDFCDNYLELIKSRIYDNGNQYQKSAVYSAFWGLKTILELFAPFMPFITEELYSAVFQSNNLQNDSIHGNNKWPLKHNFYYDSSAFISGNLAIDIITLVRKSKSARKLSVKAPILLLQVKYNNNDQAELASDFIEDLKSVTNSSNFLIVDNLTITNDTAIGSQVMVNIIYPELMKT
ncbi:tRNA synthetases class I family protein [Orientia chuto str. Dubai]|uniref:valine--tRNA ligase n=1 Tax=Orientia chuto str. Dubai TaxID=1359168 RepID=A0A0F3MLV3_9RICK|nr:tRNA synthetases class I family protein [Orientia chuto str. Dubai]